MTSATFEHKRRPRATSNRSQASNKPEKQPNQRYESEPADDSGISDLSEGQALFASMRNGYHIVYRADQPEAYYRTEYSNG